MKPQHNPRLLPPVLALFFVVLLTHCGTRMKDAQGRRFSTTADAATITVTTPDMQVSMTGVNHSTVNGIWAATVRGLSSDLVSGFKSYLLAEGFKFVAGRWYDFKALENGNATELSLAQLTTEKEKYLATLAATPVTAPTP